MMVAMDIMVTIERGVYLLIGCPETRKELAKPTKV